jgi:ribose transport system permease protein
MSIDTTNQLADAQGPNPVAEVPPPSPLPGHRRTRNLNTVVAALPRYAVVIALGVLVVVFSLLRPDSFFTLTNLQTILTTQAPLLIVAVALSITLAADEFDLSIAGTISFTAILAAHLSADLGLNSGLAILLTLGAAALIGIVNALFVVGFRISSFIVTLAMGTFLSGVALGISGSSTIGSIPHGLSNPMRHRLLGIGMPFWYAVVLVAVAWYVVEKTPFGRYLFFTGEGREAATLVGVRVNRVRLIGLTVSAIGAGAAGIILTGQTGAADASYGDSYLLETFAAAFLGAATIKAGRFNVLGTVVAVLLLAVGTTGLQLLGLANWVTMVFEGLVLIAAVAFASVVKRR